MRIATHVFSSIGVFALLIGILSSSVFSDSMHNAPVANGGAPQEDTTTITIVGQRLEFAPTTATAKAGEPVTIQFENAGRMSHNIGVLEQGATFEGIAPSERSFITLSETLQADGQTEFTFTIDEPGEYTFICNLPGHAAGGMTGTLTVRP